MVEIWIVFLFVLVVSLIIGICYSICQFFLNLNQHIKGEKITTDKWLWTPSLILIGTAFAFCSLISVGIYFYKSWEHINAEPVKEVTTIYREHIIYQSKITAEEAKRIVEAPNNNPQGDLTLDIRDASTTVTLNSDLVNCKE